MRPRPSLSAPVVAVPLALLVVGSAELLPTSSETRGVESLGIVLAGAIDLLLQPLWVLAAGLLLTRLAALSTRGHRLSSWTMPLAGLAIGALSYCQLIEYYRFRGYAPFAMAWFGFAGYLAVSYRSFVCSYRLRWRVILAAIGCAAAAGAFSIGQHNLDSRYPTLLGSLFQVQFFAIHAAIACLLVLWARPLRQMLLGGGAAYSLVLVVVFAGSTVDIHSRLRSLYRETTSVGIAASTRRDFIEPCSTEPAWPSARDAETIFAAQSNLPALPDDFAIEDYNIVLISVDALRTDYTVLGGAAHTPHLAGLLARGAHGFTHAYATAPRTWLSIASLFSMRLPSFAPVITRWPMGDLLAEAQTVAELFAGAGFSTAALRHDFQGVRGLEQGFATVHLEPGLVKPRRGIDENLAARTIDTIATAKEPFFLWSFFTSPHAPYLEDKEGDVPNRYRAAVTHFDTQLGRVLDFMDRRGLLEKTIVIVTADHGEEISEDSGMHGTSLRSEGLRVPLVVWIPGQRGTLHRRPVSQVSLFPWLLRSARSVTISAAALASIRELALVLRESGGAVIAERIGNTAEHVSLIWETAKLDYNYKSELMRIFDPSESFDDSTEHLPSSDERFREAVRRWQRFRVLRACLRRIQVTADPVPVNLTGGEWQPYRSLYE